MSKTTNNPANLKTVGLTVSAIGVLLLTSSVLAQTAAAKTGPTLKIENFIGTIDVVSNGSGKITVTHADGAPVSKSGGNVTIDAGYKINNTRCKKNKYSIKIAVGGWKMNKRGGYKNLDTYPHMKISAPANTHLIIEKSVIFGDISDIGSGDVHVRSCGDLSIGNVAGDMKLGISGSGDVEMGNVGGSLYVGVSGSGDAKIGDTGPADISVSGSGDLQAETLVSLELSVSGSGDVQLGNIAQSATVSASGSSDIELGRIAGDLEYQGSGSSDFESEYVGGDLTVRSSGAGDITIENGDVDELYIKASGASNVSYDGNSNSAEAYANGAADVRINAPSGKLRTREGGAGDVTVDG